MPRRHVRLAADRRALRQELADVRRELKIPAEFPPPALAEAWEAAASPPRPEHDLTDVTVSILDHYGLPPAPGMRGTSFLAAGH